jgi:ribonuclease P/MRP protein subunit POP5
MRRRYLAVKIVCQEEVSEEEFMEAVWTAVLQLFGEYGASKTGLVLIEFNQKKRWAVLRCSHKAVEMVRAAVASVTKINQKPAVLHVIRISGTIKALHKTFI